MAVHPQTILSWFRNGFDTHDLSKRFGLREAEVADLLHEARRTQQKGFVLTQRSADSIALGALKGGRAALIARNRKPVTLPTLSFLKQDD